MSGFERTDEAASLMRSAGNKDGLGQPRRRLMGCSFRDSAASPAILDIRSLLSADIPQIKAITTTPTTNNTSEKANLACQSGPTGWRRGVDCDTYVIVAP